MMLAVMRLTAFIVTNEICSLVQTILMALVPIMFMVTAWALVLAKVWRYHATVMLEEVVSVVYTRP